MQKLELEEIQRIIKSIKVSAHPDKVAEIQSTIEGIDQLCSSLKLATDDLTKIREDLGDLIDKLRDLADYDSVKGVEIKRVVINLEGVLKEYAEENGFEEEEDNEE